MLEDLGLTGSNSTSSLSPEGVPVTIIRLRPAANSTFAGAAQAVVLTARGLAALPGAKLQQVRARVHGGTCVCRQVGCPGWRISSLEALVRGPPVPPGGCASRTSAQERHTCVGVACIDRHTLLLHARARATHVDIPQAPCTECGGGDAPRRWDSWCSPPTGQWCCC